ncbi:MAG: hypothetical protein CL526_09915 [Aequorivita sp.]|nr:hypothetical protein [Aequorivita sp.]|tara:strand:+ start:25962 stop:26549 length:588 start_codon:yes stop_codon:yes gene_type:complete
MNKIFLATLALFFASITLTAQEDVQVISNTLEDQMTEAFTKSNSYQEYKVIKKTKLATLKKNVLDSVAAFENKINAQQSEIALNTKRIDSLQNALQNTQQDLALSREKEDGIEIFGVLTSKTTYNTIMWSIIIGLLIIAGILFFRFLNNHKLTKAAQLKLAEMEIELEDHRRNSLEREQKLRRKLQDEINKNRKV